MCDPCSVVNWGDGNMKDLYTLSHQVDKLQSQWSTSGVRHRQRSKLKSKASLLRSRIRSVVDETHKKLCTYLCSNYAVVLMPEFQPFHAGAPIAEVQTPNPKHQKGSHLNWVDLDCQVITLDSHSVLFCVL